MFVSLRLFYNSIKYSSIIQLISGKDGKEV